MGNPLGLPVEPPNYKYAKPLALFALMMVSIVSALFGIQHVVSHNRRSNLLNELNSLSTQARVRVNNVEAPEPRALIGSLKRISNVWPHHSHPTDPIDITIQDNSRIIVLRIGRDSERTDEYWIFMPGRDANGNPFGWELGHITDPSVTAQLRRMGF